MWQGSDSRFLQQTGLLMRSTIRLMGIADWITLGNGVLGTLSILFMILAFDGFAYGEDHTDKYIWLAMLFIMLSAIGDLVDGPVARRYSKRRHLGSYLDLMSDSVSFGCAPALLIFAMYSRLGEASPWWTVPLAIACSWVVMATMLRLARFQHESDDGNPWFHGLASPGNAVLLVSLAGFVWIQPQTSFGPAAIEWANGSGDHPGLDMIVLPMAFLSGCMMIADRRMPKANSGMLLRLSLVMLLALLGAIIVQLASPEAAWAADVSTLGFGLALLLVLVYILMGPSMVSARWGDEPSEVEGAVTTVLETAENLLGYHSESE